LYNKEDDPGWEPAESGSDSSQEGYRKKKSVLPQPTTRGKNVSSFSSGRPEPAYHRYESAADFLPDKFDTIKRRREGKKQSTRNPSVLPAADLEIRESYVKIYRDPQLLHYAPFRKQNKKKVVKEAFILSKKGKHMGPISRLAAKALPAPTPPPVKEFRRPSVCSGVDPLRPLFQQVSALPRNRCLDFDNLSLSDDFSQLISSPQFENLVQSFVILKQKTLEVNLIFFIYKNCKCR
jgi:hypothetical protein